MILEKIRHLCSEEKITITELERILEFGNGTIRNWGDKNPTLDKIKKVAEHFNVSVDALMDKMKIPSKESREIAVKIDNYTEQQKNLLICYMSIIESGKAV